MIKGIDIITIFSESAKKLAEFYEKKVGLKNSEVFEMGDDGDEAYMYEFKGCGFAGNIWSQNNGIVHISSA